jgi:hypothetical protein
MRFFCVIFFCLLAGLPGSAVQSTASSIDFDGLVKDTGRIMEGETIRQIFKFTNKGTGILQILSVEPS